MIISRYEIILLKKNISNRDTSSAIYRKENNMIIKNYTNNGEKISYTVECEGLTLDVVHTRASQWKCDVTDVDDFLWQVSNSNVAKAEMVERFVDFQSDLLLNGVSFEFDN